MRLSIASERLLPRERAPRFAMTRESYGRCIEFVALGRRLIVDLIR